MRRGRRGRARSGGDEATNAEMTSALTGSSARGTNGTPTTASCIGSEKVELLSAGSLTPATRKVPHSSPQQGIGASNAWESSTGGQQDRQAARTGVASTAKGTASTRIRNRFIPYS